MNKELIGKNELKRLLARRLRKEGTADVPFAKMMDQYLELVGSVSRKSRAQKALTEASEDSHIAKPVDIDALVRAEESKLKQKVE